MQCNSVGLFFFFFYNCGPNNIEEKNRAEQKQIPNLYNGAVLPTEADNRLLSLQRPSGMCGFRPVGLTDLSLRSFQVKKYFELEPLARGKRWILEGSTADDLEASKESFGQFIGLLEDKDTEPARI